MARSRKKEAPLRTKPLEDKPLEELSDPLVAMEGLLKTREELLRLSLTHYSTVLSSVIFPLIFKIIVFDGMAFAGMLATYLKESRRHSLALDMKIQLENHQEVQKKYTQFIADLFKMTELIDGLATPKEMAEALDILLQNRPKTLQLHIKNRFFDILSSLAAFSEHEAFRPYLNKIVTKTTEFIGGNIETHASRLSGDIRELSFESLYELIEIAKNDHEIFGAYLASFPSPGLNLESLFYSNVWAPRITHGLLIAAGILGKYIVLDPLMTKFCNRYLEKPFVGNDKIITASELQDYMKNPGHCFLEEQDVKDINDQLIKRNKELEEKVESSITIGAGMIALMIGATTIGYNMGGYEVHVMTFGACTLITTAVNGYTYLSRSYLRWNLEETTGGMYKNLIRFTEGCQQNPWTILPGETLLATQFTLKMSNHTSPGQKPLPPFTVRQAMITALNAYGIKNIKTRINETSSPDEDLEKKLPSKKSNTTTLIVGADSVLIDRKSMGLAYLKRMFGKKDIGELLNNHFKSLLERYHSLYSLQPQIIKLAKALECSQTLIKIPGVDSKKLPSNTYIFPVPEVYRRIIKIEEIKKIFSSCQVELQSNDFSIRVNGHLPANKLEWPKFIEGVYQDKALLQSESLRSVPAFSPVDDIKSKIKEKNVPFKERIVPVRSWNPLKGLKFFNQIPPSKIEKNIQWKSASAVYPRDKKIKLIEYPNLKDKLFIRFNLPKETFPNPQCFKKFQDIVEVNPRIVSAKAKQGIKFVTKSCGKLVRGPDGEFFPAGVSVKALGMFGAGRAYGQAHISETGEVLYDVKGFEPKH